ncbi:hypothetical protein ACFQS2_06810 [Brachybacterium sp. GCM10030267]
MERRPEAMECCGIDAGGAQTVLEENDQGLRGLWGDVPRLDAAQRSATTPPRDILRADPVLATELVSVPDAPDLHAPKKTSPVALGQALSPDCG